MRKLRALTTTLVALAALSAQAATLTFTGPQDANGNNCDPNGPHCIIGDPLVYRAFTASLTQPTTPGGNWTLVLNTNYGTTLPGNTQVIPGFKYGQATFAMCDFLISWDNRQFGIVLSPHDGYQGGTLVETVGYQTSGQVMGALGESSPRPNMNVLVKSGEAIRGLGTVSAVATGANGLTQAAYRVTASFSAPAGFLSTGVFSVQACSYVCANGLIIGSNTFQAVAPDESPVPEPGTVMLSLAGLGAVAFLRRRRSL